MRPAVLCVLLLLVVLCETPTRAAPTDRPNVILIMTDNHGPWTLGCYGNKDIRTPHIDRLADEGTLFERAYANNAVCSPTRATVLTGLMLSQHGVHRFLRGGAAQVGPQAYNMLEEFDTLPSQLVEAGYVAGLSGKWHLGGNVQPQEGFTYWITKPHGGSNGFYDQEVIQDGEIRKEPQYLTDLWTDHAIKFITSNQERSFFLFLAYNGPYGLGGAMREEIRNRHRETYANHPLPSFPRTEPQPWNYNYAKWIGDEQIIRKYAAEVSGIDDGVGRVRATLDELGLTENTLIVFTADQGLSGGHAGYWGMGDHTRPLTAFDWTMHIPLIFHRPGVVKSGQRIETLVSNYDLFPTILSLAADSADVPRDQTIDVTTLKRPGRDLSPMLRGESPVWEQIHFYEFENVRAVRTPEWKYIERIHQSPNELYDLRVDPNEHDNLYGQPEHGQTLLALRRRLHRFFDDHADPKWDLWHGGKSKTDIFTEKFFGIQNPYSPSRWSPTDPPPAYTAP